VVLVVVEVTDTATLPTPALPGQVRSVGGPAVVRTPPSQPTMWCELPKFRFASLTLTPW
jgi:hypothetical protein